MANATLRTIVHIDGTDARRIHGDKPVSPGSIAIGVVIGRMSEFFDFFVYGLASVLVFPQLVIPIRA